MVGYLQKMQLGDVKMMDAATLGTIVVTVVGSLSSAKAWEFWMAKSADSKSTKESELKETHLYRDDLKVEVKRLRDELKNHYAERDKENKALTEQISELKEQLATFRTRVEFLERENEALRK